MNAIDAYWKTLGRGIEAGLQGGDPVDARFADIATAVLRSVPAPRVTAAAIADWMIEEGTLPDQVNFYSGFGEPPLVVYQTDAFYIEVLFWFPGPTSIHGHGFQGAFVVLDGFSIQVDYEFHEHTAPEEGVRLGRLEPHGIEFIAPGKVCAILRGTGFIHSVTHLGNPSLTLVARTYGNPKQPQFRYHRCGFAVLCGIRRPQVTRQAEVLAALYAAAPAEFPARLSRLLERMNDVDFYSLVEALLGLLRVNVFTGDVLPVIEAQFAAKRPEVVAAVRERVRTRNIWAAARAFPNTAAQVQCALADAFPDAAERTALLCRSYGVTEARNLPAPWRDLVCGSGAEGTQST
ncbi:MAG TPA: hypothetical protein VNW30_08220 [Opitutaceae bacterium]|nr:hypothetical protein [Opitutaceae bacterium]